jgi:hypothetical protein
VAVVGEFRHETNLPIAESSRIAKKQSELLVNWFKSRLKLLDEKAIELLYPHEKFSSLRGEVLAFGY